MLLSWRHGMVTRWCSAGYAALCCSGSCVRDWGRWGECHQAKCETNTSSDNTMMYVKAKENQSKKVLCWRRRKANEKLKTHCAKCLLRKMFDWNVRSNTHTHTHIPVNASHSVCGQGVYFGILTLSPSEVQFTLQQEQSNRAVCYSGQDDDDDCC